MRRTGKVLGAVVVAALLVGSQTACESQEQRQKIETLAKQVTQLQQDNSSLKQQVESLTKENQDLRAQLEAAAQKPAPRKK